MSENAGSIEYTVDMQTEPLLKGNKQVDESLDGLQKGFDKTDKAAKKTGDQMTETAKAVKRANGEISAAEKALQNLARAALAYIGVQTVTTIIQLADAYGEMAERIRALSADSAEYEMIQRRLMESANATYRPIEEAQELFVRTSGVLRDLGYNTSQALDIVDSFSLALVRNSASGLRAESAISSMSKALQKGRVDADAWESIIAAIPTLVDQLAESTGMSTTQIRELGVSGKITGQQLSEAFRKGHADNIKAAGDMAVTTRDAFNNLTNTLTAFIGKTNEAYAVTNKLATAIQLMTKGFRFSAGMYTDQEKLNVLHRERVELMDKLNNREKMFVGWTKTSVRDRERVKQIEQEMLEIQNRRIEELKAESASQNAPEPAAAAAPTASDQGQKRLEQLRNELDLLKVTGVERARLQAIQALGADATAQEREEAEILAEQIFKLEEAQKAATGSRKTLTAEQRDAKKAADELAKAEQANVDAVTDLAVKLSLANLKGQELAQATAQLQLNQYATPEQIEQVRALAAELAKVEARVKAQAEFGADGTAKILGDVDPLSGGAFDAQFARYEAERVAEEKRYAEQLERLRLAKEAEVAVLGGYQALEEQMAQTHADRLVQIEQAKNSMLLSSGADMFASLASAAENFGGKSSSAYQALFAISKGFAIANAGLNLTTAIVQAMADPTALTPAQKFANMASVAAAGGALISQISSAAFTGRAQGGPVAAGQMYRINEGGAPEVYNAANGQQYMLPNQRGQVVSNADASAGGTGMTNVITISVDGSGTSTNSGNSDGDSIALAQSIRVVVVDELERQNRQGGILWSMRNNG